MVLYNKQCWSVQREITTIIGVLCVASIVTATASCSEVLPSHTNQGPRVCIVIRTYWGHEAGPASQLQALLKSLQRQTYTRCVLAFGDIHPKDADTLLHALLSMICNKQDEICRILAVFPGGKHC